MRQSRWVLGVLSVVLSFNGYAATYTDSTSFLNAVNALGLSLGSENYASYPLSSLSSGQTLGSFNYNFDPLQTQPAIVSDGVGGQALGGPFDVFIGGDTFNLSYVGTHALLAFGAEFSYAPNFENLPANLYQLKVLDGDNTGFTVGNPAGLSGDGGSFFLGFILPAGDFRNISLFSSQVDGSGAAYLTPGHQVNDLLFATAAVPEPAQLPMLISGLGLVSLLARRSNLAVSKS